MKNEGYEDADFFRAAFSAVRSAGMRAEIKMFAKLKIYLISLACHVEGAATHWFSISKRLLMLVGQDYSCPVCEKRHGKHVDRSATKPVGGPRRTRKFYEILVELLCLEFGGQG